MSQFFISYSRKDSELVEKIVDALVDDDLQPWIDWKNIPKGEEVQKEIYQAIEESEIFLYFVSPDSVASKWCIEEVEHAAKNSKRILPIVIREVDQKTLHIEISKRNWVFCREGQDDLFKAIGEFYKTIHTDYEWLKYHTLLQLKALSWKEYEDKSLLLRGKELRVAENQLFLAQYKEPSPTDLQRDFIVNCKKYESQVRIIFSVFGTAIILTLILAVTGKLNRFIYSPVGMDDYWITIPAGQFQMGSSDKQLSEVLKICPSCQFSFEQPQHLVDLPEYQIGKYEVTNYQYNQCIRAGFCAGSIVTTKPNYPVTNINWYAATQFCNWTKGRLPTEAEWEKAARGGLDEKKYPWGDISPICEAKAINGANFSQDGCLSGPMPVGSFAPNGYGLYDMAGNVGEWTSTLFQKYPYNANDGREDLSSPDFRVLRGGAWDVEDFISANAIRGRDDPINTDSATGFRCARDIP